MPQLLVFQEAAMTPYLTLTGSNPNPFSSSMVHNTSSSHQRDNRFQD
ncbi:hypothetical protein SynMITS9220_01815 [Synechococcus sp. MIT S9220]|nr:hypothetical protein SynMITS9220_01815 [Synechococcus sp. MIT S9220]